MPTQAIISADLVPSLTGLVQVTSGEVTINFQYSGTHATHGAGQVIVNTTTIIPEPSTLGLLASGLIGLAGMARRKLKLPV